MIELANDPKASPPGWRAGAGGEARKTASQVKPERPSAIWPFPSRYAVRPRQQGAGKPAAHDSGS